LPFIFIFDSSSAWPRKKRRKPKEKKGGKPGRPSHLCFFFDALGPSSWSETIDMEGKEGRGGAFEEKRGKRKGG